MALICGDLTLVTCIEQLLGLDHFLCALLMFYHADFYSKCSVVGPVPQQGPLELQVFALPCCSCSGGFCYGCLAGSVLAAYQEHREAQDPGGCEGRHPGHFSAEPVEALAWLPQGPQDGQRQGCPRSGGQ